MNIVNERVEHVKFGPGVITELNGDKIWVQFEDNIGTKIFIYPDAFEKFLIAVNPIVGNNALEDWHRKQEQVESELQRMKKEREAAELEEKEARSALTNKRLTARVMKKKT